MLCEVFYRPAPIWLVPGSDRHAPHSYAGKIVAARPKGEGKPYRVRHNRRVAVLDLSKEQYADARNSRVRMDVAGEPRLVPVTFDDRWGYVADKVPDDIRRQLEDYEAASLDPDDLLLAESREEAYRTARRVLDAELAKMPRPDVHSGAGDYRVEKGHAVINDQASNYVYTAGPDTTTFDLTTGGLTTNAEVGDLVVFATGGADYVVVSNTPGTVTVNGDCSGENDPDNITIDAFDAIQDAIDELEEDQGVAAFAAEQRINVYTGSGAYTETVNLDFNFAPRPRYYLRIAAASGESPVQSVAGLAVALTSNTNVPYVEFAGFTISGAMAASTYVFNPYYISDAHHLRGLTVTATGYATSVFNALPRYSCLKVENCSFTGTGSEYVRNTSGPNGMCFWLGCTFKNFAYVVGVGGLCCDVFHSCEFDSCIDILRSKGAAHQAQWIMLNCVVYNTTTFLTDFRCVAFVRVLNCVFHTVVRLVKEGYANSKFGHLEAMFDGNCYHNITEYLFSTVDGTITDFAAWKSFTGQDANSQEADPLLTNPGAGDFTLQATSPCRKAGRGAGVALDRAGAAFDPYHPDQGAHSTGVVGAVPGTPSAEYMSAGLNVNVHLDGDAGVDNYARLIDKDGGVVDEDSITGDGSVGLTATTPGPHGVVAWSADGDDVVRSKPTTVFPFECLTFAVPNATVQFELGPDQVVLTAPIPGPTERDVHHDASLLTAAGVRYAYDKGVERQELELTFESLTESEKIDLKDFYDRVAEGVVNLFQYTDSNGTLYSARFLEPTLEFTRVAVGVYDVSMLLELEEIT